MQDSALLAGDTWFGGLASTFALVRHRDTRGTLLPVELDSLPFAPRRIFTVAGVPAGTSRGGHGHRTAVQMLICVNGEVRVQMRYAGDEVTVTLSDAGPGLLMGAGIWAEQTYVSEQAVLWVICSEPFNPDSYFRQKDGKQ